MSSSEKRSLRQRAAGLLRRAQRPELSVVIPCLNARDFIEASVRSVLNQSMRDLEVIVVDDGSDDGSQDIVTALAARDRRVRLVESRAGDTHGAGAARNRGVDIARGHYLAFVDADDKVLPGAYRALLDSLKKSGSSFAIGGYRRHGKAGNSRPKVVARVHREQRTGTTINAFPELLDEPVLWNRIFDMRFWRKQVGRIPEDVNYEDQEPCLRAALQAGSIDVLTTDVYSWRLADGRQSRSQSKAQLDDLHDRMTIIDRMSRMVDGSSVDSGVRLRLLINWLGRDLVMYAKEVPNTDEAAYEPDLRTCAAKVAATAEKWGLADSWWAEVPFQDRLIAWELINGTPEDLEEVIGSQLEDTTAVPIVMESGRLLANPPMLGRIAPVPETLRTLGTIDLSLQCATETVTWLGPDRVVVAGDAHVPGLPAELRKPLQFDLVCSDGLARPIDQVVVGPAPDANFRANDPWTDYSDTGFEATATLPAETVRLRVSTQVGQHTVEALLAMPPGPVTNRIGPCPPAGEEQRLVFAAGADGSLEFRPGAGSPFRVVEATSAGTKLTLQIACASLGTGNRIDRVALLPLKAGADAIDGSGDTKSVGDTAEVTVVFDLVELREAERQYRLIVESSGETTPVLWDAPADAGDTAAVRVRPMADGTALVEQRKFRVSVCQVSIEEHLLQLDGTIDPQGPVPVIWLVSSGTAYRAEVTDGGTSGTWHASVDVGDAALPSGGYFVRWSVSDTEEPEGWCRPADVMNGPETYLEGPVRSVRVAPRGNETLGLTVGVPLDREERTRFGRQQFIDAPPTTLQQGIVFETYSGKTTGDNPRAIFDYLQDEGLDVPMWWSVIDGTVPVPVGGQRLVIGTREWAEVTRSARVLVTNNNFPQWFQKQKGQYFLQTWHGTPIKRLLFDAPKAFIPLTYRRLMTRQVAQWDLLLAQSEDAEKNLRSSTGYTGEVYVGEQPRNVRLLAGPERGAEVRKELGIGLNERVILYAPTWREAARHGVSEGESPFLDCEWLAEASKCTVLVRSHHMNSFHALGEDVIDVTDFPDVEDLMLASDALVSDYSSIVYDWAALGRPSFLYTPDIESYGSAERGFYNEWPDSSYSLQATSRSSLLDGLSTKAARKPEPLCSNEASLGDIRESISSLCYTVTLNAMSVTHR
ncbi:bifunctional glycosyltransferase/CDP-glycerol:glycerophosphate glycerophosphotransferase [Brevibacterium moorei]|uniref:bifunctional glycosyltransferase/CDP-glycerol:glycerophosphate glycerophosphotransferase n=1 Tax=Brevibacterium moorei TaxID=2968457 RepID=UPI00211BCEEE|nr:bifunctional glycosyltransferase family 2 protein/CDP-glycerol:glycerophosphate glycerophosphotransferase [Brevibacterium sp. 68QC2CO]MCQ9386233.1 bifunctional glycosyltransferase family 2 protein/CDP-glycerol:glycerophosphate glycerophosphotransferase [Brevibacterium sp. 68QC2CO]